MSSILVSLFAMSNYSSKIKILFSVHVVFLWHINCLHSQTMTSVSCLYTCVLLTEFPYCRNGVDFVALFDTMEHAFLLDCVNTF